MRFNHLRINFNKVKYFEAEIYINKNKYLIATAHKLDPNYEILEKNKIGLDLAKVKATYISANLCFIP